MTKGNLLNILLAGLLSWGYISSRDNFFLTLLVILIVSWIVIDDIDSLRKEVRNIKKGRKKNG